MKIYDISQEVFSSAVYPGDPAPRRERLMSLEDGDACRLTAFYMCAHNGTHIDAPAHFCRDGASVDMLPLVNLVGYAYVISHSGEISASDARHIIDTAVAALGKDELRILIRGDATLSESAAELFATAQLLLYGNESQSVGTPDTSPAIHRTLLSSGVVILEGIVLSDVPDGVYLLSAAPLNLGQAEGAPCRALLIADGHNA